MPPTNNATISPSPTTTLPTMMTIFLVPMAWLAAKVGPGKIVDDRRIEQQAIDPVEDAAMARQKLRGVFGAGAAFQRAFGQITQHAQHVHDCGQRQGELQRQIRKEPVMRSSGQ